METTNEATFSSMPEHYGIFPFIIVRIFSGSFVQLPVRLCNREFGEKVEAVTGAESESEKAKLPTLIYARLDTDKERINRRELLNSDEGKAFLTELLERVARKNKYNRCAVVLGPDKAVYYEGKKVDGESDEGNQIQSTLYESDSPPRGGMLFTMEMRPIQINETHWRDDQPEFIELGELVH